MEHTYQLGATVRRWQPRAGRGWIPAALLAAAVTLAACGSPAASSSQPSAPPPAAATAPSNPAAPATAPAGQAPVASPAASVSPAAGSPAAPSSTTQAMTKLNLNTATREQFLAVPNVGDRMVREFFEYRPYVSIQQFRREIGKYVSQEQVAAYEQYVYVPVDPNNADVETLRQLPGVDASIASQLVAGRPYASNDAFLTRLGQYVSTDQAAAARAYLATP